MNYCEQCGNKIEPNNKFCENCGRNIPNKKVVKVDKPATFKTYLCLLGGLLSFVLCVLTFGRDEAIIQNLPTFLYPIITFIPFGFGVLSQVLFIAPYILHPKNIICKIVFIITMVCDAAAGIAAVYVIFEMIRFMFTFG